MRTKRSFRSKGQIMMEYAVMITLIALVLAAMVPTIRAFFGGFFFNKTKQMGENTPFAPGHTTGTVGSTSTGTTNIVETSGGFITKTLDETNNNDMALTTPF